MVGESGEFDVLGRTVGTAGESDTQYFGCRYGVVGECFVEVAYTEKEYRVGMFCFHLGVLLHQRCLDNFFCHGPGSVFICFCRLWRVRAAVLRWMCRPAVPHRPK